MSSRKAIGFLLLVAIGTATAVTQVGCWGNDGGARGTGAAPDGHVGEVLMPEIATRTPQDETAPSSDLGQATEASMTPLTTGMSGAANDVYAPEVPPDFTPDRGELPPGVRQIGSCLVPADAVEIFPQEAVTRGQRVFDSPAVRIFLRADGSCVNLWKGEDIPVPDYAPDTINAVTPPGS